MGKAWDLHPVASPIGTHRRQANVSDGELWQDGSQTQEAPTPEDNQRTGNRIQNATVAQKNLTYSKVKDCNLKATQSYDLLGQFSSKRFCALFTILCGELTLSWLHAGSESVVSSKGSLLFSI